MLKLGALERTFDAPHLLGKTAKTSHINLWREVFAKGVGEDERAIFGYKKLSFVLVLTSISLRSQ